MQLQQSDVHLSFATQRGASITAAVAAGLLGLLGLGLLRWLGHRLVSRPWLRLAWLLPLAVAAGWAVADIRAVWRLDERLQPALEGVDLRIEGRVQGLPRFMPEGVVFEAAVEKAVLGAQPVQVPASISLAWFRGFDGESLVAEPPQPVRAGDRWQWTVRLKRPHGLMNPQGFDLELWLFERGLGATGAVRGEAAWLGDSGHDRLDRWRQALRDALLKRGGDPARTSASGDARSALASAAPGVLAALSVGDQSAIDRAGWELFRVTGVSHLMSVSGLHVTMWAWAAALVVRLLWRQSTWLAMRCPAPVAARWGGLAFAALYALLAGWGVPAQRTVWMLATITALQSSGRYWPATLVLLVAACVVVLLDPWALLQVGFWLSFLAVALLMFSSEGQGAAALLAWRDQLRAALRTQWLATWGLAPLTLLFFQQLSLVGFFANLFAIPWVTVVVTPLAMLSTVLPLAQPLGEAAVVLLMTFLQPLSAAPWAQWSAAAPSAVAALMGLTGGVLAVAPWPMRLRLAGACLMLPMLLARAPAPAWGEVRLLAFDVGQGTAVWVQTQRHALLYDAGPVYAGAAASSRAVDAAAALTTSTAATRVLLPWLRSEGMPALDRLVLSHRDADHTGGAAGLLAQASVRSSLSSLEDGHPLLESLPEHQRCLQGQFWEWDGVRFEVLHPQPEHYARAQARQLKPNGLSCVIRVVDRHGPRVLLTGDIEAPQEAELVRHAVRSVPPNASDPPGTLRASVLLLPHHGSQTSSTSAFLEAVQPQITVAQAAYRSRFGHPAAPVLQRLLDHELPLRRSDTCGAWQWPAGLVNGGFLNASVSASVPASQDPGVCERERRRRYWHHAGDR